MSNHKISNVGNGNNEDEEQQAAERNLIRKSVDFHVPAVLDLNGRLYTKACRSHQVRQSQRYLQPHSSQLRLMGMPLSTVSVPMAANYYFTWLAHTTRAKNSTPVMCISWTPGGRRLLTGNQEGEFTLWDGINFSFELIMSAHDTSFRSMAWSHNRNYLLTSDAGGNIKYWSPSIAPVQSLDSHNNQAIHALSFSPSDTKFVSGGDDATVRIWDWASHREERILEGHGWDVKVSGSGAMEINDVITVELTPAFHSFLVDGTMASPVLCDCLWIQRQFGKTLGSTCRNLFKYFVRSQKYRHQSRME